MAKIAIILSGCGFLDGSEIYESVLTFLALDRAGAEYQCFAPNIPQKRVVNYLTKEPLVNVSRNVLEESARLARGAIKDIAEANPKEFAAIIFPGGFGAALNLCDFAEKGGDAEVNPQVLSIAKSFKETNKPLGFICIAPAMIPLICGKGVTMTIGNDQSTAQTVESMGAVHQSCLATDIVIDQAHKVVSTPAYMLGKSIAEVATGIEKLVKAVLELIE